METSRVTPSQILPPKAEGKQFRILANDGRVFYAFEEVAEAMEVGRSYDVEYLDREYHGQTYTSIKRIKAVDSATLVRKFPPPAEPPSPANDPPPRSPARELSPAEVDRAVNKTVNREMLMFVEAIGKSMFEGQHPMTTSIKNMGELEEFMLGLKQIYHRQLGV